MEAFEPTLAALAEDLARLATTAGEPAIAHRLIDMADEVMALAVLEACDSSIYDSATFLLHMGITKKVDDPYADSAPAH